MRRVLVILAAAAAGSGGLAAATIAPQGATRAEEQYRTLLADKAPGRSVDCIDTRFTRPSLSAYGDKLLYRVGRDLVWVNDTTGGCSNVTRGDALVTRQYQTRLCRGDIAQTVNLVSRIPTGSCALGAFTPYRAK